jgi:nucleoside-diphosphate-sugar epimerase
MSYLITGADGFIGTHFCNALKKRSINNYSFDSENDGVLNPENFSKFRDKNIQVLVHFAAKTFVPDSWKLPGEFINLNVTGTLNALEFCRLNNCKMIFISSYMYGTPEYLPIDEEHKESTMNPYALSKKMSEEMCEFYSKNFNVSTTIVRPFNIYGPNQSKGFLIPFVHHQLLNNDKVIVKDLEPKRDYLYIDDFVEALLVLSLFDTKYNIFNLGYGKSCSVQDIIDISQELINTNIPVYQKGERRINEVMDVVADIQKIKRLTGWSPKVSLKEGLANCLKSMKHN